LAKQALSRPPRGSGKIKHHPRSGFLQSEQLVFLLCAGMVRMTAERPGKAGASALRAGGNNVAKQTRFPSAARKQKSKQAPYLHLLPVFPLL
jgi:hypothetical protein